MGLYAPDVSEHQDHTLDDTFNRRVAIVRAMFSPSYPDQKFLGNAIAAAKLFAAGKIDGIILYCVMLTSYTAAQQYDALWKLVGPKLPPWLLGVMLDVESWDGTSYAIHGNRSPLFNRLAGMHSHNLPGGLNSVPFYGNEGNLAEIIPDRDPRMWGILARYSGALDYRARGVHGVRGQQYTDGKLSWGVPVVGGSKAPIASKPFGPCDHNYLDFASGKALRAFMRPDTVAKAPTPPVVLHPPVVQPKPAPGPALPPYNVARGSTLVSTNGHTRVIVLDNGGVLVQRDGKTIHTLAKGA